MEFSSPKTCMIFWNLGGEDQQSSSVHGPALLRMPIYHTVHVHSIQPMDLCNFQGCQI